ncbi:hypothetical protein VTJ04DRAFT_9003 [Mycothermus thermophilus]|uniref:mitochondrial 37S ribosomal protein mS33 n=1 Tax=Humicola insolens TaxID=85995 RepID=UPI003744AA04
MSVPRARLLALMKARCELFGTTYNPEGIRTGGKILRQRLKGPVLVDYYPRRIVTYREFQNAFKPLGLELENDDEYDRLEHIELLKARGKGAPKKKGKDSKNAKGKK